MSAPPYPPNYHPLSTEDRFRAIINKHEISLDMANRLQQLRGFKIVFIFDDSGSMNAPLDDSPLNNSNSLIKATRWNELQYFAKISVEIASLFDSEGCSIYFLNKEPSPLHKIKDESQIAPMFVGEPEGFTPLPRVLDTVLRDNDHYLAEKKLLVVIATDGAPTDDNGNPAIPYFKSILEKRDKRVFTSIVACTDDEDSVNYLNKWDRELSNLDLVDDFRSERKEIKRIKGKDYQFSFGDYVAKSLIGGIDAELDRSDEKKKKAKCIVS